MPIPVLYLKLVTGDEIISVVEITDDSIILYNPLQIHSLNTTRGTSVQFGHWAQFTDVDIFEIKRSHIVFSSTPKTDILQYYNEIMNTPKDTIHFNEEDNRTIH